MKKFIAIFLGFGCFLGSSYLQAIECNANDPVCMARLNQEISDSGDGAVLGMVAVGFGIYYLMVDKPQNEKKEALKNFREGKGLPIYNTNKFSIEIPSPNKFPVIESDSFFALENKKSSLLEFRYKFN
jgi:hypothetical protein